MRIGGWKRTALAAFLAARAAALRGVAAFSPARSIPVAPRRILIVRLDRLGDLVLTTSLLPALRDLFPGACVEIACAPALAPLLAGHPRVAAVLAPRSLRPADLARFAAALRGRRYDLALDPTLARGLRPALLARSAGPCVGFAAYGKGPLYDLAVADPGFDLPFAETILRLLAPLGYGGPVHPPRLVAPRVAAPAAARILHEAGIAGPFFAVHPGSFYPSQRYPHLARATLLSAAAGHQALAVASPHEADLLAPFRAAGHPRVATRVVADLAELLALLARARVFLGNNSGPLHAAAALGLPTVSTLGPTRPRHFAPHGAGHAVFRLGLPCSPCDLADCPDHGCLRGIDPADVAVAVGERMGR